MSTKAGELQLLAQLSSAERAYQELVKKLLNSRWRWFSNQYPVLIRQLCEQILCAEAIATEFQKRLETDQLILKSDLSFRTESIKSIRFGFSDPHNGGQTVAQLIDESGCIIYYKPRDLSVEHWFNTDILGFVKDTPIKSVKTVNREGYGWQEDASKSLQEYELSANSREKVYACFAAFMCLLNSSDLHFENIRYANGRISAIDLETILGSLPLSVDIDGPIWRLWSVLSTELFYNDFGKVGHQLSSSGFFSNESLPEQVAGSVIRSRGNGLVLKTLKVETTSAKHIGLSVDCINSELLVSELRIWFEYFLQQKVQILSCIRNKPVLITRCVLRPTQYYQRLLQKLTQPRCMRSFSFYYNQMDSLKGSKWFGQSNWEFHTQRLIGLEEIRQLRHGDIPIFKKRSNSLDLYGNSEKSIVNTFFKCTSDQLIRSKLLEFKESDIEEQCTLVAASLDAMVQNDWPSYQMLSSVEYVVEKIVKNIVNSTLHLDTGIPVWISYQGDSSGDSLKATSYDHGFYGGSLGVIFCLQAFTSSNIFSGPVVQAADHVLDRYAREWSIRGKLTLQNNNSIGLSGLGGALLASAFLLSKHDRWKYLRNIVSENLSVAKLDIEQDNVLDVVGGTAGLLIGCYGIVRCASQDKSLNNKALHLIKQCVDKIQSSVEENENGAFWPTSGENIPLLGFAHGIAGYRTSLALAYKVLFHHGDEQRCERIRTTLISAGQYTKIQSEKYGWIDFRKEAGGSRLNNSWCHGFAGLTYSERAEAPLLGNKEKSAMIEMMLSSLENCDKSTPRISTFCCGDAAAIDATLGLIKNDKSRSWYTQLLHHTSDDIRFQTTIGVVSARTFPGLYQGASGVAYVGLRCLDPSLPSLSGMMGGDLYASTAV